MPLLVYDSRRYEESMNTSSSLASALGSGSNQAGTLKYTNCPSKLCLCLARIQYHISHSSVAMIISRPLNKGQGAGGGSSLDRGDIIGHIRTRQGVTKSSGAWRSIFLSRVCHMRHNLGDCNTHSRFSCMSLIVLYLPKCDSSQESLSSYWTLFSISSITRSLVVNGVSSTQVLKSQVLYSLLPA
ncbi:hypothetical protein SCLCIDRAFT_1216409 [Scleroderma citrinum Foug A]|uniref:Uncharacterized protein n=1 Tax=Scleroderma citrinum Foug A TaxID=1036808 RepID=A0A0C3DYD0_9AGAM|nr:hypothetical protein SCLCIDRAFT_1216409 [Scleroderma citrinum Foug A]